MGYAGAATEIVGYFDHEASFIGTIFDLSTSRSWFSLLTQKGGTESSIYGHSVDDNGDTTFAFLSEGNEVSFSHDFSLDSNKHTFDCADVHMDLLSNSTTRSFILLDNFTLTDYLNIDMFNAVTTTASRDSDDRDLE